MSESGTNKATHAVTVAFVIVPLAYTVDIYDYALLPKRLTLACSTTLALLILIVSMLRGSPLRLPQSWLARVLAAYGLVTLSSAAWAPNPTGALGEATYVAVLLTLGLVSSVVLSDIACWRHPLRGLIAVTFAVSLLGILEYWALSPIPFQSTGPPSATFGFRNFAAMFLVAATPLTLLHAMRSRVELESIAGFVAFGLATLFLIYTRTRGAWLGVTLGFAFAGVFTYCSSSASGALQNALRSRTKRIALAVVIVLIVCLAPLGERFVDRGLQRFDEKKADIFTTVSSIFSEEGDRGRRAMWGNSARLIRDNLFAGVGLGGWQYIYPKYDGGDLLRSDSSPKRPHNDYIWVTAETGLLGGGLYVAAHVLILVGLWRLRDRKGWSLSTPFFAAAIVGVAVHAFFSFPKEQPQAMMFVFAIAGSLAAQGRALPVSRVTATIGLTVLLILNGAATHVTLRQIQFDRHFLASLIAKDSGDWQAVEAESRRALFFGTFRPHALVVLGRSLERTKQYREAERAYFEALEYAPFSWQAHNGLGIVYKRTNRNEEALAQYEAALAIYPSETGVRNNLGTLYRATGNIRRAESLYREVLRANRNDAGANNNLGNILKSRGDIDSAEVYYRRALNADSLLAQAHNNLAELLFQKQRYGESIHHYIEASTLAPDKALSHWGLGQALESAGDLAGAETAYREAIRVNPRFPRSYFSLGRLLYELRKWEESGDLFRTFLTLWEGDNDRLARFAENRIAATERNLERARNARTGN